MSEPSLYVNDAATLEDGFGTTLAGDQVARMALEADTPFTLGVTGKWGSGKTSVLRRAFVTLGGQPVRQSIPLSKKPLSEGELATWEQWAWNQVKRKAELDWTPRLQGVAENSFCVWYSPWQHQSADNPLVPLLHEIQAQFNVWMRAGKRLTELNRRGGLAGLALLERVVDAAVGLTLGRPVKAVEGTSNAVRAAWRDAAPAAPELGDGQRFHLLFEDAVSTLLDGVAAKSAAGKGRLVLFIDDLDRCEESRAVQLLEAIKLYLGTRRCVFVLGIDESAVIDALKRHWQGRTGDTNREYLEKLFQAIVPVPVPRAPEVETFVARQFAAHGFPDSVESARLVGELLEPNPRKIKNFVNSACAGWRICRGAAPAEAEAKGKLARQFLLFQYLRIQHKRIWRLLERQPWSLRVLTKVLKGAPDQTLVLPDFVKNEDQRLLEKLFIREFAHVLRDDGGDDERHRHLKLDRAIELFEERIDRKRSDEYFIRHYSDLIEIGMDLPSAFLEIPRDGAAGEAHG